MAIERLGAKAAQKPAGGSRWARTALVGVWAACVGCEFLPHAVHEPVVFNPFPQIHKVAVAPFFNLTTESWVDGRQFALAYYNELQAVPGFEVVPIGVVERAVQEHGLQLARAEDAQRLAQLLEVDAVVVGAVTDFSPYYPPRCGLIVEWYGADPHWAPILPGYGLPWHKPQAEQIPERLRYEAAYAWARAAYEQQRRASQFSPPEKSPSSDSSTPQASAGEQRVSRGEVLPVLKHVAIYHGNDPRVVAALQDYYALRKEARFGDWAGYLQRSDDFIRFCCRMHIYEMLSARGGAGKTRVVWQWPFDR